ncbi:hypothetical protein SAMN00808754_1846 [Thermanaeromonas toyohensis ToBE]|uniref:DUF6259 domain-containing protein n=1 Tax=Thermanaeromonas toyohensis ToBE TaxID=698762 RepID=A0A1W1VVL0_9FIRM|nr:DUF6259 domain-containing protein [Thermanaeromonas toyohensis]SMB97412.1 hypothetical protein SAMN00808754_1846 [Thermanaeromonas toyohensis ToBE]
MAFTLSNPNLVIKIEPQDLEVKSLVYLKTGEELIKDPYTGLPLLHLFQVNPEEEGIVPRKIALKETRIYSGLEGGGRFYISWEALDSNYSSLNLIGNIEGAIDVIRPRLLWQLTIRNNTSQKIWLQVLFPQISGLGLGMPKEEFLALPHHAGDLTRNPIQEYTSLRYQSFGRAATKKEGNIYVREINYCGLASMNWMDYHRRDLGIYFGCHDPNFGLTGLRSYSCMVNYPSMGLGFRRFPVLNEEEEWVSPPFILEIHEGDWHSGARIYREWATQFINPPCNPKDLAEQYALHPRYDFFREGKVLHSFSDIPALYERGKEWGIKHFFIAGWNHGGFDAQYPDYHPAMELGSPLELERGCRYINADGGMVTFYINARLFDTGLPSYKEKGYNWAIKRPGGDVYIEQYDTPSLFAVMCPASEGWQGWLKDLAIWMVKAYGARGIYFDQLGSAEPFPCYHSLSISDHHPHHPEDYNRGYLKLLKETLEAIRKENPKAFLMIENCGDIYGQYVWGSLTWNGVLYDEHYSIYRYTFPEHSLVMMVHPKRLSEVEGDEKLRRDLFYQHIEQALLLGAVFWIAPDRRFGPGDEQMLLHANQMLKLRASIAREIARCHYVDQDGILSKGEIAVSHWIGKDDPRFHLICIGNHKGKGGEVEIEAFQVDSLWARGLGGELIQVPWKYTDRGIKLLIPPEFPALVIGIEGS